MPDIEVFAQVTAFLSDSFIERIPGDKEDFLRNQLGSLGVLVHKQLDKNLLSVTGKLDDINSSKVLLENKLLFNHDNEQSVSPDESYYSNKNVLGSLGTNVKEETFYDSLEQSGVSFNSDKEISSHISVKVEELNDTLTQLKEIHKNINEDMIKEGKEKLDVSNKDLKEDAKVFITKSGREIKIPSNLSNYRSSLLDQDDNLDNADGNFYFGNVPKRRSKRKVGRPRKVKETKVPKVEENVQDKSNDVNDDIKGDKEITSGNVYLNKGEKTQDKKRFICKEALLGMKGIKKYYEDRLPYKYFCQICSFKSKRESHYLKHAELHEKNPNMKLYKCDKCDFSAIRISVLQRHSLSHISDDVKILKCSECQYTTNNESLLRLHRKRHISNKTTHSCHLCSFSTLYKKKLRKHIDSHGSEENTNIANETSNKTFQCNRCIYNTTIKLNLRRHQQAVHLNQRPHLCDICGMAFKRTDALRIHKEVHKDRSERKLPFSCKVCQKAFYSMAHVKEHMSVHTNVRSFQCHICGQMFKTRQVQQRHLQGVHLKTNWHECSRCKRSFSSKYTLKRHLRQHDDDANINLQGNMEAKRIYDHVTHSTVIDQGENLIEGQDQEVLDENATAIQTITISSENLGEFTQHLQTLSSQLQSSEDIGEIYIQGLETVGQETINIVSVQGEDIGQISEPIYTEHVPQLSTSVEDSQSVGMVQDLISENDKMYSNLTADQSLQIISNSQSENISSVRTRYNIPVETYKLSLEQENSGTDQSSTTNEIIDQVSPKLQVLNCETGDIRYVADQGQIIKGDDEGHYVQFVASNGQTYRVQIDRPTSVLNMESESNQVE